MNKEKTPSDELNSLLQEVASTRETAQKIADEGPSPGSDVPRVLAGLVAHLAGQVERLATAGGSRVVPASTQTAVGGSEETTTQQIADAFLEEDASPEDASATPVRAAKGT